jgi:hypothetical protein
MKSTLHKLLLATDNEVFHISHKYLGKKYRNVKTLKGYYSIYTGDIPITLVAHVDKYDNEPLTEKELIESNGIIRTSGLKVLGADDRAGVYSILCIVKKCILNGLGLPSVILTNFEETKGIGAKEVVKGNYLPPCNLLIELDREGTGDYVTYNMLPSEVEKYIENFGFRQNFGTGSDIKYLTDHFKIPSVNLSIGYYDQHTYKEYLCLDSMELTINRVLTILKNPINKLYRVEEPIKKKKNNKKQNDKLHCPAIEILNTKDFCDNSSLEDLEKLLKEDIIFDDLDKDML